MASTARKLAPTEKPLSVFELPIRDPASYANRRSLPRVAARFELTCDGQPCMGVDLSFGGLMCVGAEPLWPGSTGSFALTIDGQAPLRLRGRVVELVPHKGAVAMRVRFEPLDGKTGGRIAAWMAQNQRR
jgi:hypothetical protein